ncbi:hypothetical protein FACS1894110_14020 [Spirochaetia bacterium]|nr:hypothetical protein FACS1894110_14020 [Spirochaetia bacterium]
MADYDDYSKTLQNNIPYTFKPKLTGFPAQVQQVEDFHGGFITAKGPEQVEYLENKIKETSGLTFRWEKERYGKTSKKELTLKCKFSGRTTTKCALTEHKDGATERDEYLLTIFPVGWHQFDIHAEVPATIKLLWSGIWLGTKDDIHLRKDIMKKIGIEDETDDDKTCTFRWCFEPSMAKAKANFIRAKKGTFGKKKYDFSLSDEQFIEGWARMQNVLFGSKTGAEFNTNLIKDWKQSIWWWTGRIEEETKKSLIGQGFRVANAFDCFYSNGSIDIIKEAIDGAAILIKKEFDTERALFIERWRHYSPNSLKEKKVRDNHAIAIKAAETKKKIKERVDRITTIDPTTGKRVRKLKDSDLVSIDEKAEKTQLSGGRDCSDGEAGSVISSGGGSGSVVRSDYCGSGRESRGSYRGQSTTRSSNNGTSQSSNNEISHPFNSPNIGNLPEIDSTSDISENSSVLSREEKISATMKGRKRPEHSKALKGRKREVSKCHYLYKGQEYIRLKDICQIIHGDENKRIKTKDFTKYGITKVINDS